MHCMRCGRELKEDTQIFCPSCQERMNSCPVPPGTPIQLPNRQAADPPKKRNARKRKEQKPEEQIARLRHTNRWLTLALIVTVLAFAFTAIILIRTLEEPEVPLGRNFGTSQSSDRS